ncbi:CaiB/BaiF CoA transferase family protein [Pseudonocardia parietis]|uniref:Alpha-methylacyl-CoA racemase n=1 Tax=Pseudonocardia parietis TaxID=570936 RepID=A0ABS4VW32_9PSEU|nr:CaiB/BaiF CoA-transferase family protein [Pseudonocardia parietis]MBP2367719.1 alpha-methylacyl-CoA racemase [Pseudonocardia parietis]
MASEPPLAGVRVVEFLGIGPAPFASMMLADLGAEVLAVARPGTPRPAMADNRPVLELDLKSTDGAALAHRLAEAADVLVEGFRPGVLERAGLGPETLLEHNPRLVYARMTGWGQHGPLAPRAGHDLNYIALTGALHHASRDGAAPTPSANLLGDFGAGGMYLVTSVLAALLRRERTGRGETLDVAIVDGTTYLTAMLHEYRRRGTWSDVAGTNRLDTGAPFYDVYDCADGRHVAIGALEPQFFAELVTLLGLDAGWPARRDDPQTWPELRREIAAAVRTRTRDEWAAAATGTDACLSPVLDLAEAAGHPHLRARGVLAPQAAGWRPELPGLPRPEPTAPADILARWQIAGPTTTRPGTPAA